jgi:hypothetical protein
LTPPWGGGRVTRMGAILIRAIPDPIHKDFKKLCQTKKTSMEKEIVRLILREITKASKKK